MWTRIILILISKWNIILVNLEKASIPKSDRLFKNLIVGIIKIKRKSYKSIKGFISFTHEIETENKKTRYAKN
jgi:hypothetical protein